MLYFGIAIATTSVVASAILLSNAKDNVKIKKHKVQNLSSRIKYFDEKFKDKK